MFKILTLSAFIFSGCSHFTFNVAMCTQIASEPNSVMPQECRNYIEEEAVKAYFKNKTTVEIDGEDIKFKKEK